MSKGYVYTIDAAIAILIIVAAIVALFAAYVYAPRSSDANALTSDVIQLLSETRMSDLCSSTCDCAYDELEPVCQLPGFNRDAPLANVIGEAHYRGEDARVESAIETILRESGAVPRSHGIQIILTDENGDEFLMYGDPV